MTDNLLCEKCGTEMVDHSSGDSIYVECPKCGWGWATTTYDSSNDDDTDYELWLAPGNPQDKDILKLVAKIAGTNLVQAKRLLSTEKPIMIYKAHKESVATLNKVQRVQRIAHQLSDAGVLFHIVPDFPYKY